MSIGTLFWILMILSFLGWGWGRPWSNPGWGWGSDLLVFVLLFLLGWHSFGFVIHG
jgi:hypothetical protein